MKNFFSYVMSRTSWIKWWWSLLWTRSNMLSWIFYSASWLKQQSAGRHVAPLRHIILISSQAFCSYSLILHVQNRSSKNQFHSIWFDMTRVPALETRMVTNTPPMLLHSFKIKDNIWQWRWQRGSLHHKMADTCE